MKHFDVIVIGAGHAGVEAADASARLGASTCLVTLRLDGIGQMSCNPAIGGLGKGHLVREIDALDGLMGRAADAAGIQFRLLNRSRGPAVQGPRAQADRSAYAAAVRGLLARRAGLTIAEGEVGDLVLEGQRVTGVRLADGSAVSASAVVLTAGTFLNGVIHVGDKTTPGGRVGDRASITLAQRLRDTIQRVGRLKTGTPPRLDGSTIDWSRVEMQPGDERPEMLSFLSRGPVLRQVSCGITATNPETHEIVRRNLGRSAMYAGSIEGRGPRYCPSIEDKVTRFADRDSHQVFLEPEGLEDRTVYPNGISTSLPAEVQEDYVRTIRGLENVRILRPGYAIEYDYFDPRCLGPGLNVRGIDGLWFAGQINGTTGYEEAGAQGLVAGANAALSTRGEAPFVPDRGTSYIGVLIDDLVTQGVTEPYRMFTSRAEHRLVLRADNADQRLTSTGAAIGLVGDERQRAFEAKARRIAGVRHALTAVRYSPQELGRLGIKTRLDGVRRSPLELLANGEAAFRDLSALVPDPGEPLPEELVTIVVADQMYAPYIERLRQQREAMLRDQSVAIPEDIDFRAISGLSNEIVEKLSLVRPVSISQASRIEGMTPAALALLHLACTRWHLRAG